MSADIRAHIRGNPKLEGIGKDIQELDCSRELTAVASVEETTNSSKKPTSIVRIKSTAAEHNSNAAAVEQNEVIREDLVTTVK